MVRIRALWVSILIPFVTRAIFSDPVLKQEETIRISDRLQKKVTYRTITRTLYLGVDKFRIEEREGNRLTTLQILDGNTFYYCTHPDGSDPQKSQKQCLKQDTASLLQFFDNPQAKQIFAGAKMSGHAKDLKKTQSIIGRRCHSMKVVTSMRIRGPSGAAQNKGQSTPEITVKGETHLCMAPDFAKYSHSTQDIVARMSRQFQLNLKVDKQKFTGVVLRQEDWLEQKGQAMDVRTEKKMRTLAIEDRRHDLALFQAPAGYTLIDSPISGLKH